MSHHAAEEELEAGLDEVFAAPSDHGTVELVVRRPAPGEREVLEEGRLDVHEGMVGDDWRARGARARRTERRTPERRWPS